MLPETKPGKFRNTVKVASIAVATVIIAALIVGIIVLVQHPTSPETIQQTPTTAATPTPTPTPTPSTPVLDRPGVPVLVDPMTSPNAQDLWNVSDEPWGSCGFGNGGYDVKVPGSATGGCNTTAATTIFTDFIYEINMTIVSGVTNVTRSTRGAGLMFRYNNDPDGVSNTDYGIGFQQDGTYYLYAYNHGTLIGLGTGHCSSFHQGAQQTNLLDIEMKGPTITLFVNNVFVLTTRDTHFQSGYLGVQIGSGSDPSEVVYSNLKVWNL